MCSGADPVLLAQCSGSEQIKQAGIGGTVFFTALMAFVSSAYALFTVFDQVWIAMLFGLVWGLLIFNLDRFIVSTIRKRDRIGKELIQAIPRILLAVIIAVVISKPLELKLFEKEIDRVILESKNAMTLDNREQIALTYTPQIEKLETENDALKAEIATKEQEVNALYATYIAEAEGREGTLKIGKGPVYAEKREKHDAALSELQALRTQNNAMIAANRTAITQLKTEYESQVNTTQPVIDGFDGLMARIDALGALPWWPTFFIFLLFLAVETMPIISKLMAPKGEYDIKLEQSLVTLDAFAVQQAAQQKQQQSADAAINDKIYEDLREDEELYRYKRQRAADILKFQADVFYERQKGNV